MVSKLCGSATSVRLLQLAKALSSMDLTPSGIVITSRRLHPSKILLGILVMLAENLNSCNPVHPSKTNAPTSLTLSGSWIFVNWAQ